MPTGSRTTVHHVDIDAPPDVVYSIIADATQWPLYFTPTVHVERSAIDGATERLHIWATANGEVKSWTSRRQLDPARRTIAFRQEKSSPPVTSMGGRWTADEAVGGGTVLTLAHDFTAEDDAGLDWLTRATDRNSDAELRGIKALAERWERRSRTCRTFEDSVVIEAPLDTVYEFLYEAGKWTDRLPHVSAMDLREDVENVQVMTMRTTTADGSSHTTESVRVCFAPTRIAYKQVVTPALMSAHTGEWTLRAVPEGVRAVSRHSVVIEESAVTRILGADATVDTALDFVRGALGRNSTATLGLAKEYAEAGRG
ncbi:aromatase/cyclase [Nocardiopsis sediminis]|uniref:Aromatase/cyclase n=1 Tax=Nocardiopsis sediminis TaxID=1778267 RepID=A0ABV8FU33_9ACTN